MCTASPMALLRGHTQSKGLNSTRLCKPPPHTFNGGLPPRVAPGIAGIVGGPGGLYFTRGRGYRVGIVWYGVVCAWVLFLASGLCFCSLEPLKCHNGDAELLGVWLLGWSPHHPITPTTILPFIHFFPLSVFVVLLG